mmetsp:Transcript_14984/g.30901  ORF Transcript_14984/g.30901 Transcript_14984/m.30901 type:complete len:245 (+) Transcript_14984:1-735(+)
MEGAKHVLRYLKGTINHGIFFRQNDQCMTGHVGWPASPDNGATLSPYTDSNWGPQDASDPKPEGEETRMVMSDEVKSLQGAIIVRSGGPLWWTCERETRTSRSSSEAEIKSLDIGDRQVQYLRHICRDLELNDANQPTPIWNDNKGCIDWAKTGAVTKKLRYLNIKEFAVRDSREAGDISIHHIDGKANPADLSTKEIIDIQHFLWLRDLIVCDSATMGGDGNPRLEARLAAMSPIWRAGIPVH